jgi:hypothetical protein
MPSFAGCSLVRQKLSIYDSALLFTVLNCGSPATRAAGRPIQRPQAKRAQSSPVQIAPNGARERSEGRKRFARPN